MFALLTFVKGLTASKTDKDGAAACMLTNEIKETFCCTLITHHKHGVDVTHEKTLTLWSLVLI